MASVTSPTPKVPVVTGTGGSTSSPGPTHVSEAAYEFLLGELLHFVETTEAGSGGGPPPESSVEDAQLWNAERAAAKIERLGYGVGYRLCERLVQAKPLGATTAPHGSPPDPALQLEAVKFLCKEFWMELFRKQIDKLQTNHRGVFVLKDNEFSWLKRLPPDDELARIAAIKLLAFPCGLVRGALGNLGIPSVVSCDFLADGRNMAACSFNIKIK
jgi:hypothetical protein